MKRTGLLCLVMGIVSLAGCAGFGVSYYASTPPPSIRAEAFGAAPGPDYLWINGYWGWNNGAYAWVPGRWDRPPRPHATWVAPRWERRGGRYQLHEGHWK